MGSAHPSLNAFYDTIRSDPNTIRILCYEWDERARQTQRQKRLRDMGGETVLIMLTLLTVLQQTVPTTTRLSAMTSSTERLSTDRH